ncbi:MAG: M20 family metallopeptidase [Desulfarculus sp.]|nr:M20 family metallopeptidase [Desulfarculus sp.]
MPPTPDVLEMTRQLIGLDSGNPPGREEACALYLGGLLERAGLRVERLDLAPGRPNLLARLPGDASRPPLCLCGHLDTVPLGAAPWGHDPFVAEVHNGRVYGRGSSDMKSGLAALVGAALRLAALPAGRGGLLVLLTADEENGCGGSLQLAGRPEVLGQAGAVVVAEPTANQPWLGHKGALWLQAVFAGKAAHGSMPEEGDNAILKAAQAVNRLAAWRPGLEHAQLGSPTLNLGTISGGTRINMVPDRASLGLDLRTLPGQDHRQLQAQMAGLLGSEAALEVLSDLPGLWTEPGHPWVQEVYGILKEIGGRRPQPQGGRYFTDGGVLRRAWQDVPTLILGPGEPTQAHQTDEWCLVENITQAQDIYFQIARRWCGI